MALVSQIHIGLTGWTNLTYAVGNRVASGGNAYQCIVAGTSTSAPTGTGASINNGGTAVFKWLSVIDYTTLAAATAGLPATFTQPITWQFWNDGTITIPGATAPYLQLTGHTTSPTNTLTLTAAPGEGFRDSLKTGHTALAFSAAAGASFTLPSTTPGSPFNYFNITDANVIIDGLQFQDPNSASGCSIIVSNVGATGFVLRNCIIDGYAQAGGADIVDFGDSFKMANCLFVDRQAASPGFLPLVIRKPGNVVNCSAIAINTPASLVWVASNATTAAANILRNNAVFGYPLGVGQSSVAAANISIDHCASSASQIGPAASITDGGSNLVSQSAATTFVSATTDFRLILGATCVNAGATDTTDIPAATDIVGTARPQGASWDIGAFELPPIMAQAGGQSKGRVRTSQTAPAKGVARSAGRAVLTVTSFVAGKSIGKSSGRAAGTFVSAATPDPWSVDFSSAFGPLTNPTTVGLGSAGASGRSAVGVAMPLTARGSSAARGRQVLAPATALTARSAAAGTGTGAGTYLRGGVGDPWSGDFSSDFGPIAVFLGAAKGTGRSAITIAQPLVALGIAGAKGRSQTARMAIATRGSARATGRMSPPPSSAAMIASGRATALGSGLALYAAPPSSGPFGAIFGQIFGGPGEVWGVARAYGRLALSSTSATTALTATGTATAAGNWLTTPGAYVFAHNAGLALSAGQAGPLTQVALVVAAGAAKGSGRGRTGLAQPIQAQGAATATAKAGVAYKALLAGRASAIAKGVLTVTAAAALVGTGRAKSQGIGQSAYNARLATAGLARSAARNQTTATYRFIATLGVAQGSGGLGLAGAQRLPGKGTGAARGTMALSATVAFAAVGVSLSCGRSAIAAGLGSTAGGAAESSGAGTIATDFLLTGAGRARGDASLDSRAAYTVALTGAGVAIGAGQAVAARNARVAASGRAIATGQLGTASGRAQLSARGAATSRGGIGTAAFAPVALTARGQSISAGRPTASYVRPLQSLGIGLSKGRCAATAAILLLAGGRSQAEGQLAAAVAVGFQARGRGAARGALFSSRAAAARGMGRGYGAGSVAGYYNVTPDATGPRLSSIAQLPAFDAMDLGDVDFFSWDWSTRASIANDPIVSASVTASPSGLPVGAVVVVGDVVQAKVGTASLVQTFSLRCTVTLRSGRVLHWSAPVPVADF